GVKGVAAAMPPLCRWRPSRKRPPGKPDESSVPEALAPGELAGADRLDRLHLAFGALDADDVVVGADPVASALAEDLQRAGGGQLVAVLAEGHQVMRVAVAQEHAPRTAGAHCFGVGAQLGAVGGEVGV